MVSTLYVVYSMASDHEILDDLAEDEVDELLTAASESRKASKKQKLSRLLQVLSDEGSLSSVIPLLRSSADTACAAPTSSKPSE